MSVSFRLWVLLALIIGTLSGLAAVAGTGQPTQSAPRESTAQVSITPGADTGTGTESVAESQTQAEAEAKAEPRSGQGTEGQGTGGQGSAPAQDQSSRTTIYAIIGAVVLAGGGSGGGRVGG